MHGSVTESPDDDKRVTTSHDEKPAYAGILLAAGKGKRFDPTGRQNKLLRLLPGGDTIVATAARNLEAATDSVLVVIPPESSRLAAHLQSLGYPTTECIDAASGMAASLVHAVRQTRHARGWIIALGDMPFVRPATIQSLIAALREGADIAVPVCNDVRGNPVGFSRRHAAALLELTGDTGARSLVRAHPVQEVPVDDQGIFHDVDTPSDLCR